MALTKTYFSVGNRVEDGLYKLVTTKDGTLRLMFRPWISGAKFREIARCEVERSHEDWEPHCAIHGGIGQWMFDL